MSHLKKTTTLAFAGLILSAGAALPQAGGSDVPGNAKNAGAKENGSSSTGMTRSGGGGAMTPGSGASGGRSTETGGNAGGPAGKN